MEKKKAELSVASISESLATDLIRTLIMDITIEEHRKASRKRIEGPRCKPSASNGHANGSNGLLAPPPFKAGSSSTNSSPSKKEKDDSLYECLVCSRNIGASRYASHLSGCMGLGTRRGERGESRRNAAAGSSNGPRSTGLVRMGSDLGSVSSNPSDEDAFSANGTEKKTVIKLSNVNANNKRTATSPANGASKLKKAKPLPSASPTVLLPLPTVSHLASQPLTKTHSAPLSSLPISATTGLGPASAQMLPQSSLPSIQASSPLAASGREDDRPDSDSSADEDSDDEQQLRLQRQHAQQQRVAAAAAAAAAGGNKRKLTTGGRKLHPLSSVKGADSDSGSDVSGSEGSGSD